MKPARGLLLSLTLLLVLGTTAQSDDRNAKAPVKMTGVIAIPGNPLVSSNIAWVDANPLSRVVGRSFAKANNCTPVTAGPAGNATANMRVAIVTAATNKATNPNIPASDKNATG